MTCSNDNPIVKRVSESPVQTKVHSLFFVATAMVCMLAACEKNNNPGESNLP